MQLNTYLNFGGNCAEALRFYEQHLGGKILMMMTAPEGAPGGGCGSGVMHARIEIAGVMLMASDAPKENYDPMRGTYLTLGFESNEEVERLAALLAEGGSFVMPVQETFFAHRFTMLRDRFDTQWMLIHEKKQG